MTLYNLFCEPRPSRTRRRSFLRSLEEKSTGAKKQSSQVSSMASARAMFQAKTTRGQATSGGGDKDLWTQHANAIVGMEGMGRAREPTCSKLSTCGESAISPSSDVCRMDASSCPCAIVVCRTCKAEVRRLLLRSFPLKASVLAASCDLVKGGTLLPKVDSHAGTDLRKEVGGIRT